MNDAEDDAQRQCFDDEVAALYVLHAEHMCRWLIRSGMPADTADQIVTDAFLAVRQCWDRLRDENPVGYAYVVARNGRIAHWKRLERQHQIDTLMHCELPYLVERDAYAAVVDSIVLKAALLQLAPQQRRALELRHLKEMNLKETAQVMGIAEGTVKSHTHDALRALKQILISDEAAMKEVGHSGQQRSVR